LWRSTSPPLSVGVSPSPIKKLPANTLYNDLSIKWVPRSSALWHGCSSLKMKFSTKKLIAFLHDRKTVPKWPL
jgi:hypothetical protein